MTARMVQVIRSPRCPECGGRCGRPEHYPEHFLASCRRKVSYLATEPAVQHALEINGWVYECPLSPRFHWHVASGRFWGWYRENRKRRAGR